MVKQTYYYFTLKFIIITVTLNFPCRPIIVPESHHILLYETIWYYTCTIHIREQVAEGESLQPTKPTSDAKLTH